MAPAALSGGPQCRLLEHPGSPRTIRPSPRRQTSNASTLSSPTRSSRCSRNPRLIGRPRSSGQFGPAPAQAVPLARDGQICTRLQRWRHRLLRSVRQERTSATT
eukprot:5140490-Pyramimonas_sp.AAC.1